MVKNTGSQSAAQRSYGTLHVASSTINSAIFATEAYLASPAGTLVTQDIIQRYIDREHTGNNVAINSFLLHNNRQKRFLVDQNRTPNQMYSSEIIDVIPRNNTEVYAEVDVRSGNRVGRDVRKALVFGHLGNLSLELQIPPDGGRNALFIGGGTNAIANVPLNINGNATFMSNLQHQRDININNGDLWVRNAITGTGSETITSPGGITSNTPVPEARIEVPLNMAVLPQAIGVISTLGNAGAIGHTTTDGAPNTGPVRYCIEGGRQVTIDDVRAIYNNARANGRLFNNHVMIELNGVPPSLGFNPNDVFEDSVIFILGTNMEINNFYTSGPNSSTMIFVAPPRPAVTVTTTITEINDNYTTEPWGFDADGNNHDWNWQERTITTPRTYNYPGGELGQLNIRGDFRGLIYVDPANNRNQRIAIGNNINFEGAMHLMGTGDVEWNNGGGGTLNLRHSPAVLSGFGIPRVGGGGDDDNNNNDQPPDVVVTPGETINFRSSGYYFY